MDFSKIFSIALIALLGAMSPGPDFAIVVKNCLRGKFIDGFWTSVGVAAALLVHVTYCLLGVAWIISESPFLFHLIKYIGAAYLFYLGVMMLKEKITDDNVADLAKTVHPKKHNPFLTGLLTNLLNPKATLFILSLFTQFIDPTMNFWEKAFLGSEIAVIGFLWFVLLSYLITHRYLQKHFARFQKIITKTMGGVLCLLALYVALTS
jgi:RhtB (resistance to homoserine/threonine) family protein